MRVEDWIKEGDKYSATGEVLPYKEQLEKNQKEQDFVELSEILMKLSWAKAKMSTEVILPNISIKTMVNLKNLGYKLSPRLMDKNEEFYYKVYLK